MDYKQNQFNISVQKAQEDHMICHSPVDMARILDACKHGFTPVVSVCMVEAEAPRLYCIRSDESEFYVQWIDAHGYVCFTPEHLSRLLRKCI